MINIYLISLGAVYVYSITGDSWSLTNTLNGFIVGSSFGEALDYSPTGTQVAVGACGYGENSVIGMRCMMYDA